MCIPLIIVIVAAGDVVFRSDVVQTCLNGTYTIGKDSCGADVDELGSSGFAAATTVVHVTDAGMALAEP
jgi:hypothetical protein